MRGSRFGSNDVGLGARNKSLKITQPSWRAKKECEKQLWSGGLQNLEQFSCEFSDRKVKSDHHSFCG